MLTKEEYNKEVVRMWDSLRLKHSKGEQTCVGVKCYDCPLNGLCGSFSVFEQIECVEKWSKEHPVVTNADKFKEVFGAEPLTKYNEYICPYPFKVNYCRNKECECEECKKQYWEAEYKEPKKEVEE